MLGRAVAFGFSTARDFVARGLIRLGITPNVVTLAGLVFTVGAGVCFAIGTRAPLGWTLDPHAPANAYQLLAAWLLIMSFGCDMLDGAVARIGAKGSTFGAFLDSTVDRFSDFAIYAGIAAGYAWARPANVTFILLAMVAFLNGFMISYTRARAEDLIDSCSVGFWQRGERMAAVLFAALAHNMPALILQQAALPLLTVLRRMGHTRTVLAGKTPMTDPREGSWLRKLRIWEWTRMTVPYDAAVLINIAWLIFARVEAVDWLRNLVG